MAESTLTLGRTELRLAAADFLGYGRTSANWTTAQSDRIDEVLADGLRQVYAPMPLPGERMPHKWSFLYPLHNFSTVSAQSEYSMPDDYGGPDGDITFLTQRGNPAIRIVGEGQIRLENQVSDESGIPRWAALRPIKSDGVYGQRFKMVLWPTPDSAYALQHRYRILPDALTADRPYPIGAAMLSQLLKESVLAAAELALDDTQGVHRVRFNELLVTAITMDRRNEPEYYGYNGNDEPMLLREDECRSRSGLITYGA